LRATRIAALEKVDVRVGRHSAVGNPVQFCTEALRLREADYAGAGIILRAEPFVSQVMQQ